MDSEKKVAPKNSKDQDPLQDDTASSNNEPSGYHEEPQNFTQDSYHDIEKQMTHSGADLARVMSQPDNIKRLESLTRVLSTRRVAVPGQITGPLAVDPNDFDLNILLNSIAQRLDDQGISRKYTGFALNNTTVWGVDVSTAYGPSVSEHLRSLALFPRYIKDYLHKPIRPLIRDINGLVREGELLLVLGRPGSGCSTLLKTIAGEIDTFKKVDGEISYAGAPQEEMLRHFKSEVIYNPECEYFFLLKNKQIEGKFWPTTCNCGTRPKISITIFV